MTTSSCSNAEEPAQARLLAERALRAIADAQMLRAQFESARSRLIAAQARAEQIRTDQTALWNELRARIESLAREERAAGRAPERMLVLLKELIDTAGFDRPLRSEIEPDVMRWGIDAFYAA